MELIQSKLHGQAFHTQYCFLIIRGVHDGLLFYPDHGRFDGSLKYATVIGADQNCSALQSIAYVELSLHPALLQVKMRVILVGTHRSSVCSHVM